MPVEVTGSDPVFSNPVLTRTSSTNEEIVCGAKFTGMYHEEGDTTVLELGTLSVFDNVSLHAGSFPVVAFTFGNQDYSSCPFLRLLHRKQNTVGSG